MSRQSIMKQCHWFSKRDLRIEVFPFMSAKMMKTYQHATAAARCGDANILMKGFVQTSGFMRAVLNSETGLGTRRVLSQTGIYQVPFMDKLILVADVGIVITPDLQQLAGIASNAVQVATALGIQEPKVAMLSPAETVNPAMPGNSNAALITRRLNVDKSKGQPMLHLTVH